MTTSSSPVNFSSLVDSPFASTLQLLSASLKTRSTAFSSPSFWIVPVYEISALADILVLNSIEFWSGSNPVADAGTVKTIETKDGTYAIETQKDGYHIQNATNTN